MVTSNSLLLVALTAATAFASQPTPGSQIQMQYFHDRPAIESHEGAIQQRGPGHLSGSLSDSDLSNLRSSYCDGCSALQFEQASPNNQKRELRYPLRVGDQPIIEARQYGFNDAYQFHNQKRHVPYVMEKHEPTVELVQPQDGAKNSNKEKRMVMLPPGLPGYEQQSEFIEEATKKGLVIAKRGPSAEPEDFNKGEDASESITKPSWTGNAPLSNNPLPQNLPSEQKQGNEKRGPKGKLGGHITPCAGILGACGEDSITKDINKYLNDVTA